MTLLCLITYFNNSKVTLHDLHVKMGLHIRGRPIIGDDIKHFTDYRYQPFSKQICRLFFYYANKHTIYYDGVLVPH